MQIGGQGIENILVNMVLECFFKRHKSKSLFWNGLNIFQFEIVQVMIMTYNILSCPT